jgi:hypothetical protein
MLQDKCDGKKRSAKAEARNLEGPCGRPVSLLGDQPNSGTNHNGSD